MRPSVEQGIRWQQPRGLVARVCSSASIRMPWPKQRRASAWKPFPKRTGLDLLLLKGNFGGFDELLLQAEIPGVNAVLFDLGVSSPQIDLPARGFSFKEDAPSTCVWIRVNRP